MCRKRVKIQAGKQLRQTKANNIIEQYDAGHARLRRQNMKAAQRFGRNTHQGVLHFCSHAVHHTHSQIDGTVFNSRQFSAMLHDDGV